MVFFTTLQIHFLAVEDTWNDMEGNEVTERREEKVVRKTREEIPLLTYVFLNDKKVNLVQRDDVS